MWCSCQHVVSQGCTQPVTEDSTVTRTRPFLLTERFFWWTTFTQESPATWQEHSQSCTVVWYAFYPIFPLLSFFRYQNCIIAWRLSLPPLLSLCPSWVFPPITCLLSSWCLLLREPELTEVNLDCSNNTGGMWGPQIAPCTKCWPNYWRFLLVTWEYVLVEEKSLLVQ